MGYDPNEFGDTGEETSSEPEKLVEVNDVNQQLSDEVERRLEIASCYRLLLNESLFNDPSPIAKLVDDEIRSFIRSRLASLVGVGAPAADSAFTSEEVQALKLLAQKAIPAFKKELPKPTSPTLRKVSMAKPKDVTVAKVGLPPTKVLPTYVDSTPKETTVSNENTPPTPPVTNRRKRQANPHAIKMPTGAAFEALSSSQAQVSAQAAVQTMSANPIGTQIVNASLQAKPTE